MSGIVYRLILFLLPATIFLFWLRTARRRAALTGTPVPVLPDTPWLWAIIASAIAAVLVMFALGLNSGEKPGGVYHPPRLENGRIVPGHIER